MNKLHIVEKYGITPNSLLNDNNISLKAKGLFGYIQSKPENWSFSVKKIMSQVKDGEKGVRSALKELEENRYLVRKPVKNKEGKWNGYDYFLFQKPFAEKAVAEKAVAENGITISKKERVNNNIINNIITSDKKSKDLATINNTEDTPLTSLLGEEVEKEPVEKPVENSEKSVEQELSANIKEIYTLYAKNNPLLIWGSSSFFVARNIIKKQIELYGFDEIKRVTKWILENKDLNEYIPKINKPYDLSQKWNSVQDAMKRNGVSVSNVIDPEFTKGNAELDNFLLLGEKVCLYDNLEIIPEYVNGSGSIQKQMDDARDKIRDWLKIDYFNIERKKLLVMNNLDDDLIKRNETIIKLIKGKQNLIVDDRAFSLLK